MTSSDKIQLPLRWQFLPEQERRDGSVRWRWKAYTQAGALAMESDAAFETLTECMEDARARGYGG
ncbi:MAG TPA: hypothetical protein VJ690_10710 [Burkholderiales bacterium]|nr:hypothetical protein [Burkholderiales bacterium]